MAGNIKDIIRVPLSTAIPVFVLYYTGLTASEINFAGDHIDYEFAPDRLNMVRTSIYDDLPKISSEFEG